MPRQTGDEGGSERAVTRRDVLKTGLAAGLGLGAASLAMTTPTPTAAPAPAGVYGGHINLLNVGYPEVWDPYLNEPLWLEK